MNQSVEEPASLADKLKSHSHLLPYISLAIVILAPVGYLIGLGFQAGYLSSFGGLSSAFPLSVTDAYVYGYYTITFYLVEWLPLLTSSAVWSSIIGVITFFVSIVYIAIKISKQKDPKQPESSFIRHIKKVMLALSPNNNDFSKAIQIVFEDVFSAAKKAYRAIWLILIWIGITIYSYEKGKDVATNAKEAFIQNKCFFSEDTAISNCIRIYDNQGFLITEGILIGLGIKRYGIFTEEGSVITDLPPGAKIIKAFDKQSFIDSNRGTK